jgi:hypothetical protein
MENYPVVTDLSVGSVGKVATYFGNARAKAEVVAVDMVDVAVDMEGLMGSTTLSVPPQNPENPINALSMASTCIGVVPVPIGIRPTLLQPMLTQKWLILLRGRTMKKLPWTRPKQIELCMMGINK